MKQTIMVVDDAKELRQVLGVYLTTAGYQVVEAENGMDALEKSQSVKVSLMILDVMMPVMDGFELMEKLGPNRGFPVIFLSARTLVEDRIKGLMLGGDDYISKPFDPSEVLARVIAVLRRASKDVEKEVIVGDLRWDVANRVVYQGDLPLNLRAKEYLLLTLFMKQQGKVFTKREIYEYLWEDPYIDDDNTIMVHISNLREKIEPAGGPPQKILTIRGLGYTMAKGD